MSKSRTTGTQINNKNVARKESITTSWKGGRKYTTKQIYALDKKSGIFASTTTETKSINYLGLIVVILIVISLIGVLRGVETGKTFYGFLQMLANAPEIDLSWLNSLNISVNLPDWLSFMQDIIGIFNGLIQILGFFVSGLVQALMFFFYFLNWVFFV